MVVAVDLMPLSMSRPWLAAGWVLLLSAVAGVLMMPLVAGCRWATRTSSPRWRYVLAFGWLLFSFVGQAAALHARLADGRSTEEIIETRSDASFGQWSIVRAVDPKSGHSLILQKNWSPREWIEHLLPEQSLTPVVRALPAVCLAGMSVVVAWLLLGLYLGERPFGHFCPVDEVRDTLHARCHELSASLSRARRVRAVGVTYCAIGRSPFVLGLVRPRIVVPAPLLERWGGGRMDPIALREVDMVLLHELGHVLRRDPLWVVVERFVMAFLLFNPAAWLLWRWARLERERCCDELVVAKGSVRRDDYAKLLVELSSPALYTPGSLFGQSPTAVRILSVLREPRRRPARVPAVFVFPMLLLAALLLGSLPIVSEFCLSSTLSSRIFISIIHSNGSDNDLGTEKIRDRARLRYGDLRLDPSLLGEEAMLRLRSLTTIARNEVDRGMGEIGPVVQHLEDEQSRGAWIVLPESGIVLPESRPPADRTSHRPSGLTADAGPRSAGRRSLQTGLLASP